MKRISALGTAALLSVMLGQSCSVDIFPVSENRVKSARKAAKVLERGPGAPGYFTYSWSFAPSTSKSGLTTGGGFLMDPNHIEISKGSLHLKAQSNGKLPSGMQIVQATSGRPYVALDGFSETLGKESTGLLRYQLSNDGQRWYWYDGTKWAAATPHMNKANTAGEINAHIRGFGLDVGGGSIYFKALLLSPNGTERVELQKVDVTGIAPETDTWD